MNFEHTSENQRKTSEVDELLRCNEKLRLQVQYELNKSFEINPTLGKILNLLHQNGATGYIVGGSIRDFAWGVFGDQKTLSKDLDIEVYDIGYEQLLEILEEFGHPKTTGKRFGVIKINIDDQEYDFSLPRRDNKVGEGRSGFEVDLDNGLSPKEAARRRDFTMNAMSWDPISGRLIDEFCGLTDLSNHTLRHTDNVKFVEDPTRVLRGMQFCSRFDLDAADETIELCQSITDRYGEIESDMIMDEWLKFLQKSIVPSKGLKFLRETGWAKHYPDLEKLIDCPQDPEWHPEGDVWIHVGHCIDEMVRICERENITGEARTRVMLGILCHDLGKPGTTKMIEGRWRSRGHCELVEPTISFLNDIKMPKKFHKPVIALVQKHLSHAGFGKMPSKKAVVNLARKLIDSGTNIYELSYVIEADIGGRPPLPKRDVFGPILTIAKDIQIDKEVPKAIITGQDIMTIGLKPGPQLGLIKNKLHQMQLEGKFSTKEEGLVLLNNLITSMDK